MSRSFDGATQYLTTASIPVAVAPLSMACWFNTSDDANEQTLMEIGDTGGTADAFSLAINGSVAGDPVQAQTRRSSTSTASSTSGYSLNTWHHACAVFNSVTDRRAFIDGGSKGTESTSKAPVNLDVVRVGARARSTITAFFTGQVAEAAIWSVTLTDAEVAALGRGVSPLRIRPQSLVFYAPLLGVGSPEPDYTAGQRTLTITGGAPAGASHPRQQPTAFESPNGGSSLTATGITIVSPPEALSTSGEVSSIGLTVDGGSSALRFEIDGLPVPASFQFNVGSDQYWAFTAPAHAAGSAVLQIIQEDETFYVDTNLTYVSPGGSGSNRMLMGLG